MQYSQTTVNERLEKRLISPTAPARGMTFSRAYAASPLCSPTRAAILTGLNPARTGLTAPNCHLPTVNLKATQGQQAGPIQKTVPVNTVTRLDPKYFTLAEALKSAGYATGHFGKWHLGREPFSPLENGFDIDVPHWHGPGPHGSYVAPWSYPDFDPDTPNEHIEDRMAKEAVEFMEANQDKPFFLNYWMFSVHAPFDAKKDLIQKYKKQVDPNSPQRSPTYAAMIESMDDAVGTLVDSLDRLGISNNTIIIFASDNGGNMYNWIDNTTPTSNAPLRGGKATMYDGGTRSPCSIVWPDRTDMGSVNDDYVQSCDFYPTILEMLEMEPQDGQAFDGISLVPALQGQKLTRDTIFTYFPHSPPISNWLPPAVSVHKGDWKLIRLFNHGEDGAHRWKLFNLVDDIGETKNVAASNPERVKEMDALIENFLTETNAVVPKINPAFDPSKYSVENEGKAEPKGKNPKSAKKRKPAKPVAGWQANGTARLALNDGQLIVKSSGGDPWMGFDFPNPIPKGDVNLKLKMISNSKGGGQVFWAHKLSRPKFAASRQVEYEFNHDGAPHEVNVLIPSKKPLTSIRLDPSRDAGEIRVLSAEIVGTNGMSLFKWTFESK